MDVSLRGLFSASRKSISEGVNLCWAIGPGSQMALIFPKGEVKHCRQYCFFKELDLCTQTLVQWNCNHNNTSSLGFVITSTQPHMIIPPPLDFMAAIKHWVRKHFLGIWQIQPDLLDWQTLKRDRVGWVRMSFHFCTVQWWWNLFNILRTSDFLSAVTLESTD